MDYSSLLSTIDYQQEFLGNTILAYSYAAAAFFIFVAVFWFLQWVVLLRLAKLAQKTKTDIDDTLIRIVKSLRPPFYYFVAFYFAARFIEVAPLGVKIINGILTAWIIFQIVIAIQILIDYALERRAKKEDGEEAQAAFHFLSNFVKWALWLVAGLMVLSNLGVNVTSLIAGLGIGGVAIAFALQNILGDLFSSFAIYFDKPFQVGDYIVVGEHSGIVEKIGIKTSRIRALQGEEIVISNTELTSARVQNFKKMKERRVSFAFGVLYETAPEKLRKIPDIVKKIIDSQKGTRLDRVHFREFADSALNYEVVYHVESREFGEYADAQQEINLQLMEAFAKEGIEFAYPTQTVYLNKG